MLTILFGICFKEEEKKKEDFRGVDTTSVVFFPLSFLYRLERRISLDDTGDGRRRGVAFLP